MAVERRNVEVWGDWEGLDAPARIGTLHSTPSRGKEIFSFEHDAEWIDSPRARALDPSLRLLRGAQYLADDRDNFGVFLDSAPDRWGRVLLMRREALLARAEKRAERRLTEIDFLLGVFDGHRMGGLRFRVDGGPFLDDNQELASPPWTSLRELEQASLKLERADVDRDPGYVKWLRMLIAPGRSLGGARPKASVLDEKKRLWIAKFPSANDSEDIGAWEAVAHTLAKRAGVLTAETRIERFGSKHHTLFSRRFDRTTKGARVHFASAMTLLGRRDGDSGASYLELAEVLMKQGAEPARDLEQLWRRIAFNVCIANVDDHLRNHGFLLHPKGWILAPAYDLNPVAHGGDGLTLNISETDNALDLDLVTSVAPSFRVKAPRAKQVLSEVRSAVRNWRAEAKRAKIPREGQERMARAFRLTDAEARA